MLALLPTAHASATPAVEALIDAGDIEGAKELELSLVPANMSRSAPEGRGLEICTSLPDYFPPPETCEFVSVSSGCSSPLGYKIGYWCHTIIETGVTTYDGYCIDTGHGLGGGTHKMCIYDSYDSRLSYFKTTSNIDKPENLPAVNWIYNKVTPRDPATNWPGNCGSVGSCTCTLSTEADFVTAELTITTRFSGRYGS